MFEKLRAELLAENALLLLGDLDRGAFEQILDEVVAVTVSLFRRNPKTSQDAIAILPTPRDDRTRDGQRTERKRVALLAGFERFDFHPTDLRAIPGQPLIYWWDREFLERYASTKKLGDVSPARATEGLYNNVRFTRWVWEQHSAGQTRSINSPPQDRWLPFINGANGASWYEPARLVANWRRCGLEPKLYKSLSAGGNTFSMANEVYFCAPGGVAFTTLGSTFGGRLHRYPSVFGNKGRSIFAANPNDVVCLLNSSIARYILESLNPGIGFEVGDVNRLPLFPIESADEIVAVLDQAFTRHEQARETSVEFKRPGPSPWKYAQEWAQRAVDRPAGAPLPEYHPQEEPQGPRDELSYQLGLALGRFDENGIAQQVPESSLPHGILFLSGSGGPDSLDHPAAAPLRDQADVLRTKFFADDHLKRYEKRPIYLPLSSDKKNYVAWCSIHRWTPNTLLHVLELLSSEQNRLAGELADASEALTSGDRKSQVAAQKRHDELLALLAELQTFLKAVQEIAERGAPGAPREVDAPFRMDLDDGVMINSAALWPLLLPQGWKDPKTWWSDLCQAKGKKDYDWSHLAARYFPQRVDQKCQQDPSLAVAHGVFWKYHPEKAYQWELRLQSPEELGPDFRLDEPGSDAYRADFEAHHPDKVRELREAEQRRRERKSGAGPESDQGELEFDDEADDE
jgi:hypothetical protein